MYEQIKQYAEQLADLHTEKFLYAIEHPEWKCWFIGRIKRSFETEINIDIVDAVLLELMGK